MVERRNAIGRARIKGKAKKFLKRDGQTDERVHHAIYAAIISHQISPGTALQEDALAGAFGVSRTIIRKVLQRLSHERLVDLVPNKGASVAQPSAGEAREVFEARRVLERIFVGQVVERASDADLNNLLKLAKTEEQAFERGDRQARVQLSGDFHRHLSVLAGNKPSRKLQEVRILPDGRGVRRLKVTEQRVFLAAVIPAIDVNGLLP